MSERIPTFNQVDEQLSAGQAASVLVERNDNTVGVGQVVTRGERGAQVYFTNLNGGANPDVIPTKVVSADKLADKHQEELATKLAGHTLRGEDDTRPRISGWEQWTQDHPLSAQEARAIDQHVRKNIQLSQIAHTRDKHS